jgi:alanine dehydrogenase
LAKYGERAMAYADFRLGVNTYHGYVTYAGIAESQKKIWKPVEELMSA